MSPPQQPRWCAPDINLMAEMLNGLIDLAATIATDNANVRQANAEHRNDFP